MESMDLDVLTSALRWITERRRVLLVTVVSTWGSSPRPEGSMLVVRDDGRTVGSVSGGCIEDDLIHRVRERDLLLQPASTAEYGVTADEAHRFGLPCGGSLRLMLEPISDAETLNQILEAIRRGELVKRRLDIATGIVTVTRAMSGDQLSFDGRVLTTVHGPRYRMLLIGAGDLSRRVAQIAIGLDYEVLVCDPRVEYTEGWDLPSVRISTAMPDDTVIAMRPDHRTAIIALTHDPKLDDLALMEALQSPAFYVGAIGSRRNTAARRERLKLFGITERELTQLHGPVGLYLGSRTPAEIAISILAEVTACKNDVPVLRTMDVRTGKALANVR